MRSVFKTADESRTKGDPVMADEGANILLSKTVPPWLIPRASYIIPQKSQKNTNFL